MKHLALDINLDAEVCAIAQYLAQKWAPIANLEAMVRDIRDAACHDARALVSSSISTPIIDLRHQRVAVLTPALPEGSKTRHLAMFDAVSHFLQELTGPLVNIERQTLSIDGPWDSERRIGRLRAQLSAKYPDLPAARPLGWDVLAQGYVDFDGQEEYDDSQDVALFHGTRVNSHSASHFVARTALPYVIYDEKCQGRKAAEVLVSAVYAQFMGIQEFLNTERLARAMTDWVNAQPPTQVFELPALPDNPHVRVLATEVTPPRAEQAFHEFLAREQEFEALPEAEKARRRQANSARLVEMMQRLTADVKAENFGPGAAEAVRKSERIRTVLLAEFGA